MPDVDFSQLVKQYTPEEPVKPVRRKPAPPVEDIAPPPPRIDAHPADALIHQVQHGKRIQQAADAATWRAEHQTLLDQATQYAEEIEKVLRQHNPYMDRLTAVTNWYSPTDGRTHTDWNHLDNACARYKRAAVMVAQLRDVESRLLKLSLQPEKTGELRAIQHMVTNCRGFSTAVHEIVLYVMTLINRLNSNVKSRPVNEEVSV